MWGDGPEAFHGVPCETGELWVTWRLGTQGPKGQGGIEAQEERGMAQDGMGLPTKCHKASEYHSSD